MSPPEGQHAHAQVWIPQHTVPINPVRNPRPVQAVGGGTAWSQIATRSRIDGLRQRNRSITQEQAALAAEFSLNADLAERLEAELECAVPVYVPPCRACRCGARCAALHPGSSGAPPLAARDGVRCACRAPHLGTRAGGAGQHSGCADSGRADRNSGNDNAARVVLGYVCAHSQSRGCVCVFLLSIWGPFGVCEVACGLRNRYNRLPVANIAR